MKTLFIAALALGVCVAFSTAQEAPARNWTIEALNVPEELAGISLENEQYPGFEGPSIAHDGGVLAVARNGKQWSVVRLKGGRMEVLTGPGGKTANDKPVELWPTPHGLFVAVGVSGLDSAICSVDGTTLKALKNTEGKDFAGYLSGISDTAGLPLLSTHRELKLMSYIHVLHVIRDGIVKPVRYADGKPVEAHKWMGICGRQQIFAIVTSPDGNFEEHAQYCRLRGEVCEPIELGKPPVPESAADTSAYVDRYFYGGERVVLGWNAEGTEFRVWLERDGKAEWLKHGELTLNRKFSRVAWVDHVTYMAGKDAEGKDVAYRLTGNKVEALSWPTGADAGVAWFQVAFGRVLLVQPVEGGDRYWHLQGNDFRPLLAGDGKPLLLPESARLYDRGFHVETSTGGAHVYVLEGDKALPVSDATGKPSELPASTRLVRVDGQPLLLWNGPGRDDAYITHVARVRSDGQGVVVLRPGGKSVPAGMALFFVADDGVYIEVLAEKPGEPSTFWHVRGN